MEVEEIEIDKEENTEENIEKNILENPEILEIIGS